MTEITEPLSIEERQEHEKQKLLDALREMPIVQIACKRAGVSRPTYYRWRRENKLFKRQAMDAMDQGVEFINDMSESQLVTLIKEKKMPAIALWLKHRHASYGAKTKEYSSITADEDLTENEQNIVAEALLLATKGTTIKKSYENKRTRIRADQYSKN